MPIGLSLHILLRHFILLNHNCGSEKSSFAPSFIIYLPVTFIYISHSTNLAHLMRIFGIPKVVEASEDFVPLLVLSADRPPELQDCGANQSINQVKQN